MLSLETTQEAQSGSFKTKVAVAVAATAAIGIVAAVTLSSSTSTAGRKSTGLFNIPEDIKGHFSGGQTTGEWTVQGKFHKFENTNGDWQIDSKLTVEGPTLGGAETYTLKDNVLVMVPEYGEDSGLEKMVCGDRENLPAYAKWAEHLDNAQSIPENQMTDALKKDITAKCPEGATSVAVVVEERTYIICADSTANTRAMYAFNEDFSFSAVSREGMTVEIEHPKGWEDLNCTTFDATLTREQAALLGGTVADDDDRELMAFSMWEQGGGNNNEGGSGGSGGGNSGPNQKKCAFFHGVGGDGTRQGLQTRFDDYWGFNRVGSRCSNSAKYLDTDSQTRGYNHAGYHAEVCASLASSDFSNPSTSIIFTHSMGGLTTRRAFSNGVCSWSGGYYQSQAPMSGSKAANFAQNACVFLSATLVGYLLVWSILKNYCRPSGFASHAGYRTIFFNHPWFGSGGKRADGRLCGTKPWGLGGWIGFGLAAIQLFAQMQRRNDWCIIPNLPSCGWRGCHSNGCFLWYRCPYNDGMVDWAACGQRWRGGSTSVKRMGINHADGTGRQGNRSGGASIDNWYKNRTKFNFNEASGVCSSCLTQYGTWG